MKNACRIEAVTHFAQNMDREKACTALQCSSCSLSQTLLSVSYVINYWCPDDDDFAFAFRRIYYRAERLASGRDSIPEQISLI